MVESIDILTLRQYFRIITSEPFSLSELGKGSDEKRMKAWKKIVEQDAELNKLSSHNHMTELIEDRERISLRAMRISAALLVLSRKDSESSLEVLKSLSIEGKDLENTFAIAKDRLNGLKSQIDEIDKEIGERKRPTFQDCMREMIVIQTYIPSVNLNTTLAEYRAAQQIVREMNAKKPKNGESDN